MRTTETQTASDLDEIEVLAYRSTNPVPANISNQRRLTPWGNLRDLKAGNQVLLVIRQCAAIRCEEKHQVAQLAVIGDTHSYDESHVRIPGKTTEIGQDRRQV